MIHYWAKQTLWILGTGVLISCIALWVNLDQQDGLWHEALEQEVLEDTLILTGELEVVERELMGIVSLYNSSQFVSREEFKFYVDPLLKKHSFVQAFEWAPRIPDDGRESFEKNIRAEGISDYGIREWDASGENPIVAQQRREYFPILYVEPYWKNRTDLGLDLSANPEGLHRLQESRNSGKPLAIRNFFSRKNAPGKTRIVILAPFYEGNRLPLNQIDRIDRLLGFVIGIYNVEKMMDQMVKPYLAKGMNLIVYDNVSQEPDARLFGQPMNDPALQVTSIINFAGRRWFLVWQADRNFQNGPDRFYAYLIAGSLFGLTILISIIVQMMATRTRQVEKQVQVRTEELTTANRQLKEEIGARRSAEARLHVAKEEAEQANRAKSAFLANMSHEIRTPMNAILGYAQILERNVSANADQQRNIRNILSSGDHLLQLINDILQISKIEAGKVELNPTNFDLPLLIEGIARVFQPLCEEKNLRWQVHIDAPEQVSVFGDEIKLKQVLINLLGNAIKFTSEGGITLRVRLESDDRWTFESIDTGVGIPKEYQEKIFDPFHQEADGESKGGVGLGLSIVKQLVELMGGQLHLESRPGEGTRFFFTVRLPRSTEAPRPTAQDSAQVIGLHKDCPVTALVADDNAQNREVLSDILENIGATVILAENGQEALECVRKQVPDIIFMDLRMPVMDGYESLRHILQEFPDHPIKAVAITASVLEHQREFTLNAGFDDFISKPFRVNRIFDCLSRLLQVEFVYAQNAQPDADRPDASTLPTLTLPEDLLNKLKESARLHDLTELKSQLSQLESLGEEGRTLLRHLDPCLRRYDMDATLKILEQVEHVHK